MTRRVHRERSRRGAFLAAGLLVPLSLGCAATSSPAPAPAWAPAAASSGATQPAPAHLPVVHVSRAPTSPTVFSLISPTLDSLAAAEKRIGVSTGMLSVFCDFTGAFPFSAVDAAALRRVPVLVAWEPWNSSGSEKDQPDFTLTSILDGTHDAYMSQWLLAASRAAARTPVMVRFAPEMNGDWRPWSTGVNSNRPGQYAAAWRHVHDLALSLGVTNLVWVFNPAIGYEGSTPYSELYPGSAYVDYLALDGYNWGSTRPWGWQSYADIFAPSVRSLKALDPSKPWGIAETASAEGPGDKAAWLASTLTAARADGAAFVSWFDFDKETDWRVSSTPQAASALRAVLSDPRAWTAGATSSRPTQALGLRYSPTPRR